MIELELPYPPSVNHYYRHGGRRTLISREGRRYRERVIAVLAAAGVRPMDGPLELRIEVYPPDRRRRDLDNLLKCTQDSLAHAGVFEDDSQIDLLIVARCEPVKGGEVVIRIDEFPLRRCPLCGGKFPKTESEHIHDN